MSFVGLLLMLCLILTAPLMNGEPRLVPIATYKLGAPSFFSNTEGWASGPENSLWRTKDGGRTWTEIKGGFEAGDSRSEVHGGYFQSAVEAWLLLAKPDDLLDSKQRLVVTYDGGLTWKQESLPSVHWTGESLFSRGPKGSLWLGGENSRRGDSPVEGMDCPQRVKGITAVPVLFSRISPGAGWEQRELPVQNGCPVTMLQFGDGRRGVAIAGSAIMFTADGGKRWMKSVVLSSGKSAPISRPVSLQLRDGEGWIGCDNGEILHTTDGGEHWHEAVEPGAIWSKGGGFGTWGRVYFTGPDVGFTLGASGEPFETSNRAKTWIKIATPERIVGLSCAMNQCWFLSNDKLYGIQER